MASMGYVVGQGLGRNNEGRAEPVPIELLPQGISAGHCRFQTVFLDLD